MTTSSVVVVKVWPGLPSLEAGQIRLEATTVACPLAAGRFDSPPPPHVHVLVLSAFMFALLFAFALLVVR